MSVKVAADIGLASGCREESTSYLPPEETTARRFSCRKLPDLKGRFTKPRPEAWELGPNTVSALKGPFTWDKRERPFQGRLHGRTGSQAFGLGCRNDPYRVENQRVAEYHAMRTLVH